MRDGWFSILVPESTTNLVINSQFALWKTGPLPREWVRVGTAFPEQVYDVRFGPYAARVTGNGEGIKPSTNLVGTDDTTYTLSCYAKGVGKMTLDHSGGTTDYRSTSSGEWERLSITFTTTAADDILITLESTSASPCIFDGVQLEQKDHTTTYCDGSLGAEYRWNGVAHLATSTRTNQARNGGREYNLSAWDVMVLDSGNTGMGMTAPEYATEMYPSRDGERLMGWRVPPAHLTLSLLAKADDDDALFSMRQILIDAIKPSRTRQTTFTLRFTADTRVMDLACVYESGLEFGRDGGFSEEIALQVTAYDPYWTSPFTSSAALGTSDSLGSGTVNNLLSRTVDGVWSDMGGGLNGPVYCMVKQKDGPLWIGGSFTGTADGLQDLYGCCYWDATNGYQFMGTSSSVNGVSGSAATVNALCLLPDGRVVVGGNYTHVDYTNVVASHIAIYNPSTGTWEQVGPDDTHQGTDGEVYALATKSNGEVVVGGLYDYVSGDDLLWANNVATFYPFPDGANATWTTFYDQVHHGIGTGPHEQQRITLNGTISGGTFDFTVDGFTDKWGNVQTGFTVTLIPRNATTAQLQARIDAALAAHSPAFTAGALVGTVSGTLPSSGYADLSFSYTPFNNVDHAPVTVDVSGLSGSGISATVTTILDGGFGWVRAIVVDSQDNIFFGGGFITAGNAGGYGYRYFVEWTGNTFVPPMTGWSPQWNIYALALDRDARIYMTGAFTGFTDGSTTVSTPYVMLYDGQQYLALGTGASAGGRAICIPYDRAPVLFAGDFKAVSGIHCHGWIERVGDTWASIDAGIAAQTISRAVAGDEYTTFWAADGDDMTARTAALTTVTNGGSAPVAPCIVITNPADSTSAEHLHSLELIEAGKRIYLNRLLVIGETITLDFAAQKFTSSWGGNAQNAILPGSDEIDFKLGHGENTVALYMEKEAQSQVSKIEFVGTGGSGTFDLVFSWPSGWIAQTINYSSAGLPAASDIYDALQASQHLRANDIRVTGTWPLYYVHWQGQYAYTDMDALAYTGTALSATNITGSAAVTVTSAFVAASTSATPTESTAVVVWRDRYLSFDGGA